MGRYETSDDPLDPLISIITVNYNGKKFLEGLFNSLFNLDYPSKKLQIIMVDNGSTDGSVELVKTRFPRVEVVELPENSGYAEGNNQGFERAKGDYIALINNDCVVEEDWLKEMLFLFKQSKGNKIGAVGSKVVFFYSYLPIHLLTVSASPKELKKGKSSRRLGVNLSEVKILNKNSKLLNGSIKYLEGFYPPSIDREGKPGYWTKDDAILAIPISDMEKDLELEFEVHSFISPNNLQVVIGEEIFSNIDIDSKPKKVNLKIPRAYFEFKEDILNSCGVKINKFLYSRDRGFMTIDEGQYSRVEEVFSPSGSSLLIRKKMLEDTGYFDKSFFTYYEDIDLFWRARLRGWKMFFTPHAVARHFHCGSGKEWSPQFTYYVIRNRLIMIFKCGWLSLFLKCYAAFVLSTISSIFMPKRTDAFIRVRVFFGLFYHIPRKLLERFKIRKNKKIPDKDIKSWIRSF